MFQFDKIKDIPEVKEFARKLSEFSFDEVKVFDFFKENFQKDYENVAEEHSALLKFLSNQRKIREHNARYNKGLETFKMDVWRFSDLSSEEINAAMNGFIRPVQAKAKALDKIDIVPPKFVNWTAEGYVTSGLWFAFVVPTFKSNFLISSEKPKTLRILLEFCNCRCD